ncbi:hypothetical protein, partial [Raoultella sp. 18091]|uniref:hypothetical protein n=1 Tax=Raoultella sp. 18091 TaxID=2681423 RepID=UPI001D1076F7
CSAGPRSAPRDLGKGQPSMGSALQQAAPGYGLAHGIYALFTRRPGPARSAFMGGRTTMTA